MTKRARPRHRWQNLAPAQLRQGLRVKATVLPLNSSVTADDGAPAELYLYDYIDSWGGEWGVSAAMVMSALGTIGAGPVNVHLNSPGGDYFEGVTIANALRRHDGTVNVFVDGLAASAASVIAMAGERIVMGIGSQMMIHEASSFAWGNAEDLRSTANMLDNTGDDIAAQYAARAGGDPAEWRKAMLAESWYTAQQAVDVGLADEIAAGKGKAAPEEDDEDEEDPAEDDEPAEDDPAEGDDDEDEEDDEDGKAPPFKKGGKNALIEELAALRAALTQTTAALAAAAPPPGDAPQRRDVPPATRPAFDPEQLRSAIRKAKR